MPRNLPLALAMLALTGAVAPARACIFGSDAELANWFSQYRREQAALVGPLAREASTIALAKAVRWTDENGSVTEFRISRVLKGQPVVGTVVRYRGSASVLGTACTPAKDTFRDTLALPGYEYLLYIGGDKLLRAARADKTGGISLAEELELVAAATASNKSLERSRDE